MEALGDSRRLWIESLLLGPYSSLICELYPISTSLDYFGAKLSLVAKNYMADAALVTVIGRAVLDPPLLTLEVDEILSEAKSCSASDESVIEVAKLPLIVDSGI